MRTVRSSSMCIPTCTRRGVSSRGVSTQGGGVCPGECVFPGVSAQDAHSLIGKLCLAIIASNYRKKAKTVRLVNPPGQMFCQVEPMWLALCMTQFKGKKVMPMGIVAMWKIDKVGDKYIDLYLD